MARPKMYGPGTAAGKAQFRRATRKPRVPRKAAVTALVKKVIHSEDEKKMQVLTPTPLTFNGGISSTTEWYNPIPIVNQGGGGSFQRIGNVIKPSLLDMHWRISIGEGVTRSCDDMVVLYVFKCKNLRSYADMISRGSAATFLDSGSTGLKAFTGILQDIDTPINNDGFTIVSKRVFKLTKGTGALNGDGTVPYSGAGGITSKHINIKLRKLPQFMYQQGNTDGLPENYGLCWALGYAKSDGSAPDVLFQDVRVDFTSNLFFTDA